MADPNMRQNVEDYILDLQDRIIAEFEAIELAHNPSLANDPPRFKRDEWIRPAGGRGISCTFSSRNISSSSDVETVLEKAGVNISLVHGKLPPPAIQQMRADHSSIPYDGVSSLPFFAGGLSLVVHPRNPHAPTVHLNYRYFEITKEESKDGQQPEVVAWWFGGGSDLTPNYLYPEDATHFHGTLKEACSGSGDDAYKQIYPAFKRWCDEYFYIPHRRETRGIGGIFFDDLSTEPHPRLPDASDRPTTQSAIFDFIKACGDSFLPSYVPILRRRMDAPYSEEERRWQLLRRGRYVEFNLIYDRGTKFGLQTPSARIESILMSLPETARWEYMTDMGEDGASREGKLLKVLGRLNEAKSTDGSKSVEWADEAAVETLREELDL
ncbi:Coproporphyrinogen oxidase [Coniophora puteana RWD-64-598 SS2]|uniref:coproporphyrinogen oxidase n=1 Tax=Coniophora puteana (strain RWD-64-598) TaxID=741705 RepID=A0A5M3MS99_CONPW|nr:Coproporphyrinogen oxidase [Coniophora puteana RWD-64-598 SS2]EIW81535.1 Coproporphyrinogen oxidase [Coniophora puteana RWD-64-598 SS2]